MTAPERPTDRDYAWSTSPIHDALLAELFRAALEAEDAPARLGGEV